MNTNAIPYWDVLVSWDAKLAGAPSGLLVFALCIAIGYVWKATRICPNRFTPLAVMVFGLLANLGLNWKQPDRLRFAIIGLIIGFLAWMFHRLLLKRLEDKFGVKLEDDSDPQAFVKPAEPKDQYDPNKKD